MSIANDYVARFILTYVIMVILCVTLLIKVLIGMLYLLCYRCSNNNDPTNDQPVQLNQSKIETFFSGLKPNLKKEVEERISELGATCEEKNMKIGKLIKSTNAGSKFHLLGKKKANERNATVYENKLTSSIQKSRVKQLGRKPVGNQEKKQPKFSKDPKIGTGKKEDSKAIEMQKIPENLSEGESPTKNLMKHENSS